MLHINDLTYRIGERLLLDRATAVVNPGQKVGLVGANGSGKSTLLKLILGELSPESGGVSLGPRAAIAAVAQRMPEGETTPRGFVLEADAERAALLAEAETATDPGRVADIHDRLAVIEAEKAPARAAAILSGLGFDEAAQTRPLSSFSGGWRMRAALAATLFARADLLLLDEPSNHLDLETRLWLEGHLRAYPGALLLVSHDRALLNAVVDTVVHLDRRKLVTYRGDYDQFEAARRARIDLQAAEYTKQLAQRRHMQEFVDRFRYKASKARQAQSRLKMLARMAPLTPVAPDEQVTLDLPNPEPLSPPLIALEDAAVGYGERPVLRGLDLRLDMDDRVALLGRNGNGKSTFLKLLADRLKPLSGKLRKSSKLRIGYLEQEQMAAFDPARTPVEEMASVMPMATETKVRAHLGRFGFTQSKADTPIGALSGGEAAKLLFARATHGAPHLLLLDEPTNHLDIDARSALIAALASYEGAVILVSHDPHLVEACADRLWLVRDGRCAEFDGDMTAYRRLLAEDGRGAAKPSGPKTAATETGDRKAARKAGAEARKALAPLRQAARSAERRMQDLTAARDQLRARLADPTLYQGTAEAATALNRELAEVQRGIAAAEADWLEAEQALEEATS